MRIKQIIGLVVAVVLFIGAGMASVFTNKLAQKVGVGNMGAVLENDIDFEAPTKDYIGVVKVTGTIQQETAEGLFDSPQEYQHTTTLEYIDRLMADAHNKGLLLYVDSPGGTVYEAEELYLKLEEYKEETGRPVWGYMAHYAASGGYLISMAADKIYANMNTTTGSIGVIMSGYDLTGLYEKLGIRYVSITSGVNKDNSKLSEEQIKIYQEQVDEYYTKFVNIVSKGRKMTEEEVRALADGRTYTANQALENGLIDEIALYEDMRDDMSEELETDIFYEPESPFNMFSSLFAQVKNLAPKSDMQILTETAEGLESGVPMYYAEQLQ